MAEDVLSLDYMPKHLWHRCDNPDCDGIYTMGQKTIPICWNCEREMVRSEDPRIEFSRHNQRARGYDND